jgi:hypothetical protein
MTRSTTLKLFFGSLIAMTGGLVLVVVAMILGTTREGLMMRGSHVVGVHATAWIAGLINTARLPDKTWVVVLLVVGLLGLVLIANVLYLASRSEPGSNAGEASGNAGEASDLGASVNSSLGSRTGV